MIDIGIDVDSTTLDSVPAWWHWLYCMTKPSYLPSTLDEFFIQNKNHNIHIPYDISKMFPEPINHNVDKMDFWRHTGVYDTILPVKDADTYINKLYEDGYKITFITHNKGNGGRSKYQNLVRMMGHQDFDFFVTKEKYKISVDILIDDRNEYLNPCVAKNIDTIRIETPVSQYEPDSPQTTVLPNWSEIYSHIREHYESDK